MYIHRTIEQKILEILNKGKSVLLLGPRQTGKTTLIQQIDFERYINLAKPAEKLRFEKDPGLLTQEIEVLAQAKSHPLVIIDEIQKIPSLMDAVQDLIDRKIAKFILTGSSARKLRRGENVNLLPGRVIPLYLDPLNQSECQSMSYSLETVLLDGSLPEIFLQENAEDKQTLLEAYVSIYLEEEIRAEAIVRHIANFSRFLELAAAESGRTVNFTKLSQEIGISHTTISSYYQILEDCLVVERIEPLTQSKTRRRLTKSQKYLLYDLGVRRIAAREGTQTGSKEKGFLFEQYVGLELIRLMRSFHPRYKLTYWRDASGPEVDWIIDTGDQFIPIEVKWSTVPTKGDAKHLDIFLKEYGASKGYIVCRTPHPMKISDKVVALPWDKISEIFN